MKGRLRVAVKALVSAYDTRERIESDSHKYTLGCIGEREAQSFKLVTILCFSYLRIKRRSYCGELLLQH